MEGRRKAGRARGRQVGRGGGGREGGKERRAGEGEARAGPWGEQWRLQGEARL